MVIGKAIVSLQPLVPTATCVTVYVPGDPYTCTTLDEMDVVPSPKFQFHPLILPAVVVDTSLKLDRVPKQLLLLVKFAVGEGMKEIFKVSFVGLQPLLLVEVSINRIDPCATSETDGV